MSNYPDGMSSAYRTEADYSCKKCDKKWDVSGTHDLGGFTPDDEIDQKCPDCGEWSES